jgi:hypothetical protein
LKQQKRECLKLNFLVVVAAAEMIKAKEMTQNWDRRAGEKILQILSWETRTKLCRNGEEKTL